MSTVYCVVLCLVQCVLPVQCSAVQGGAVTASAVALALALALPVQCSAVRCAAVHCGVPGDEHVKCSGTKARCSALGAVLRYGVVQCSAWQCCAVQCSAVSVQCSAVDHLNCPVPYCCMFVHSNSALPRSCADSLRLQVRIRTTATLQSPGTSQSLHCSVPFAWNHYSTVVHLPDSTAHHPNDMPCLHSWFLALQVAWDAD